MQSCQKCDYILMPQMISRDHDVQCEHNLHLEHTGLRMGEQKSIFYGTSDEIQEQIGFGVWGVWGGGF